MDGKIQELLEQGAARITELCKVIGRKDSEIEALRARIAELNQTANDLADGIVRQRKRIAELEARQVPEVLYDGYAVYGGLSEAAKKRTSADNVSDVLDAVVKLLRAPSPADSGEVKP